MIVKDVITGTGIMDLLFHSMFILLFLIKPVDFSAPENLQVSNSFFYHEKIADSLAAEEKHEEAAEN
ncbi:MAG: hypothetical protein WCY58_03865 [Mariniphaga sp.]|nr:hypothetical protein [Mariniphaga sp.]MDD4226657.1 hypothetical protein [Mariniphaga sp.]MDD4425613.1 hypothetical protein [Mariniphaga sp.]